MSDLSRSVPSATHVLAESVRRYRAGFPGVARAFLPVFAVFAVGQIGLALVGDPTDFGGYIGRAIATAGIGVAELVLTLLAACGLVASRESLPRASVGEIYRSGARVFWSAVWVTALGALALSAISIATLLVTPFLAQAVAANAASAGRSFDAVVTVALSTAAAAAIVAAAATLVLVGRLVFALPLAASGQARGLAALERSAGLSERRSWIVGSRLATGFLATALAIAPFALIAIAARPEGGTFSDSPWAAVLFSAGYLLVALPFLVIFLAELARVLADTAAERAVARERRPWVRGFVWAGVASWVILVLSGLIG